MSALPGYLCLVNLASGTTASTNLALTDAGDHQTFTVPLASVYRYLDRSVAPTVQAQYDDVQTLTVTGGPSGGTFTLTFNTHTTGTIQYNDTAANVQAALVALTGVGSGQVGVTGSNGGPWTVEWKGTLADAAQPAITLANNSLSGGTAPSVSIVHTQTGQAYTTVSASNYTLRYLTAQVFLNAPLVGINIGVKLSAFNYYPYASIAQANDITLTATAAMLDTTVLQGASGAGWLTYIPGLQGGSFACKEWMLASGATLYLAHMFSRDLLILSFVAPNGTNAMESYCYVEQTNWQSSVTTLAEEDLTFRCDSIVSLI